MKRILFISPSLGSGGSERQMTTMACLLKELGYHVEFLCFLEENFYEFLLHKHNIKVNRITASNNLTLMFAARKFIRRTKFDISISFLEGANFINIFSSLGGKTWKVITGERNSKESTFNGIKNKIFCFFQRYADIIVCNSENAKRMWINHFPYYEGKLKVIYNTITIQPINSTYTPKRNGKINIVIAASYQYLKNPIGVIKSLNLLSQSQRLKIHIDWYGNTASKGCSKVYSEGCELIEEYSLTDVITLNNASSSIQNKMNNADFVALLSKVEGLPNAICEALTIGKPVIMSRMSDFAKLVDGSNGYLVDWDDYEGIKNVFIKASELNVNELLAMGKHSKEISEKLFSKQKTIDQWITLMN